MNLSPPLTVIGILIAAMIVAGVTNPAAKKIAGVQAPPAATDPITPQKQK